jgi:hypothetical protein
LILASADSLLLVVIPRVVQDVEILRGVAVGEGDKDIANLLQMETIARGNRQGVSGFYETLFPRFASRD